MEILRRRKNICLHRGPLFSVIGHVQDDFRILSLTQRIGIGPAPKMVPTEDIDHGTREGRDIFFNQVSTCNWP